LKNSFRFRFLDIKRTRIWPDLKKFNILLIYIGFSVLDGGYV